jgi:hypothetical protein
MRSRCPLGQRTSSLPLLLRAGRRKANRSQQGGHRPDTQSAPSLSSSCVSARTYSRWLMSPLARSLRGASDKPIGGAPWPSCACRLSPSTRPRSTPRRHRPAAPVPCRYAPCETVALARVTRGRVDAVRRMQQQLGRSRRDQRLAVRVHPEWSLHADDRTDLADARRRASRLRRREGNERVFVPHSGPHLVLYFPLLGRVPGDSVRIRRQRCPGGPDGDEDVHAVKSQSWVSWRVPRGREPRP